MLPHTDERSKAIVFDLAKQWRLLEEKRLAHRREVEADKARLQATRAEVNAAREAVAALKVCGSTSHPLCSHHTKVCCAVCVIAADRRPPSCLSFSLLCSRLRAPVLHACSQP